MVKEKSIYEVIFKRKRFTKLKKLYVKEIKEIYLDITKNHHFFSEQGYEGVIAHTIQKIRQRILEELSKESKAYKKVLEHRIKCPNWPTKPCIECFGGGLQKFKKDLLLEFKKNNKTI